DIFFLMRKNLLHINLVLVLVFCSGFCFSNKIDDLKTDGDVERFVHKIDRDYKEFRVVGLDELYSSPKSKQVTDSLGAKAWQKADFDGNGLTDLFVNGMYAGQNHLLVFVAKDQRFLLYSLRIALFGDVTFTSISNTKYGKCDLLVVVQPYYTFTVDEPARMRHDTLIYKFGNFIELNRKPEKHKIKRVEFSTSGCFGICPVFEMAFNADRAATYNAINYNEQSGLYYGKIDTLSLATFTHLLNYIDFVHLKDSYEVSWTDDQSCTLKIIYDDDKVKTIYDYGLIGTRGLKLIYDKFFVMRNTQKWR
ncbi:MAG TPA: DUF6438 domain-containing protein, partial [Flavobacteriales bacterium]|nr:DUF6438 domain-containing protein [Flavobacteriales bacterium]